MEQTATVRMEEGYMRLTLQYTDSSFKTEICKYVGALEKELDIYPEVIHRRDNEKKFFTSVEFSGDDYACSRSCGSFIEGMITGLNMKDDLVD